MGKRRHQLVTRDNKGNKEKRNKKPMINKMKISRKPLKRISHNFTDFHKW
jgi:hypothetical protein